jgi:hypothetical protein
MGSNQALYSEVRGSNISLDKGYFLDNLQTQKEHGAIIPKIAPLW